VRLLQSPAREPFNRLVFGFRPRHPQMIWIERQDVLLCRIIPGQIAGMVEHRPEERLFVESPDQLSLYMPMADGAL
jgi:hypothetical protein